MTYTPKGYAASVKYKAERIKRVPLDMQISFYDEIKAAADQSGESVNGYIKEAIRQRMERTGFTVAADPVQVAGADHPGRGMLAADSGGVTSVCKSKQEKASSKNSGKDKKGVSDNGEEEST